MEETMSTQASGIEELVRQLAARLTEKGWMLATAESCTGGMIAAACTDLAGSSQWFERGFVTYSNEAKTEMLGVPAELIAKHGAVSEEVVRAMAEGAIRHSRAQVSIAVTGVAGPAEALPKSLWGRCGWAGVGHPYSMLSCRAAATIRLETMSHQDFLRPA
jgi:nicotinamide-nucleotide amidase